MKSRLYKGEIEHVRRRPVTHRFTYPIYMYALDLDELPELDRGLPLFGYNRRRPAAIYDRDYLMRGPGAIRDKLAHCLDAAGVHDPPARVTLVTSPRYLNYVFNPVSFFYCHAPDDALSCILAEVNNTYGERHLYTLKDPLPGGGVPVVRYAAPKAFHVSPYNKVEGVYEFSFSRLGRTFETVIKLSRDDVPFFEARLTGRSIDLTPLNHLKIMLRHPLTPHLNMPRIYREAFMLYFLRKLPFHAKPAPVSADTMGRARPTPRQAMARKAVCARFRHIGRGQVRMTEPNGETTVFGLKTDGPSGEIRVRDYAFFTKTLFGGEIGFGEAYMERMWDSPDPVGLLGALIMNRDALDEGLWLTSAASDWLEKIGHYSRKNAISGSRDNISRHYDLGNDFFALFLDETMTYSAAVFQSGDAPLAAAQMNKYRKIIRKADIRASDHVLEIGCGWGGFAIEAVRTTGCRVTAVTLSAQQYAYAKEKAARAGLADRIRIRRDDYRNLSAVYDKIVSIEMLEAVGHDYLGAFFSACDRLLAEDGLVVIQTIANPDRIYPRVYKKSDWIKKHIFPGGQVPSLTTLCNAMTAHSRLIIEDIENIGDHYALTLNRWRRAFLDKRDAFLKMQFDETFLRKWEYYLAICEAAFAVRALRDLQIVLARPCSRHPERLFQEQRHDPS